MRKMLILMAFLLTGVSYGIASVEKSPVDVNVVELARGAPTEMIAIVPLMIVPCEVYLPRSVRDVDVSCVVAILNVEETKISPKGIRKYRDVDTRYKSSKYKHRVHLNAVVVLARGNLGNRSSKMI